MVSKINADTSDGLKITSDTSGTLDIQSGGTTKMTVGSTIDIQGNELVLDADADTSIHVDTDDQIDFKCGGTDTMHMISGKVGIGTTAPAQSLHVKASDARVRTEETSGSTTFEMTNTSSGHFLDSSGTNDLTINKIGDAQMVFKTVNTVREVFHNNGSITQGTTTSDTSPWNNTSAQGSVLNNSGTGLASFARIDGDPLAVNRVSSDGNVVAIYAQGALEGSISVSGNTVSYNAFTGSHWSRLSDNSKPTILKGTIMETIDTMCEWYELVFKTSENVDKVTEIALPNSKSVGDSHTIEYMGESVTGIIRKKSDNKHCMSKVSDTEDSASIYGVFMDWNTETDYNDMYINALGTSLVRVSKDVTVSKGDLLSSKGDGTAKLQGDDIIKTKTIGKVLSNVKQETYDDGSFTVPCALYCG